MFKRFVTLLVILSFIFSYCHPVYAQDFSINQLPVPGKMISESEIFIPILVKGLIVHPDQPLNFDFIVDSGNDSTSQTIIKDQTERIAKYFLAAVTVPEDQLWVNLSPYEKDRIIENDLGQTVLGRDMLAQDYILKQLTASLINPEKSLGKDFWARIYRQAQEKFGTTQIPVNTFNKVWIMPDKAEVFEKGNVVYVTQAKLKVMLDSDRTAMTKNASANVSDEKAALTKAIMRNVVIPAIEKEVNTGKNFAVIRQVYYAAILAKWYRELIQNTLLADAYVGKNRVAGVTSDQKTFKEEIYQRYIAAYKKGVFNYIKEDLTPEGQSVPRKYFSGGISDFAMQSLPLAHTTNPLAVGRSVGHIFKVGLMIGAQHDAAMMDSSGPAKVYSIDEDNRALNDDINRFVSSKEEESHELIPVPNDLRSPKAALNPLFYRAYAAALRLKLLGDVSGVRRLADYQHYSRLSNNPYQGYLDRISAELTAPDVIGMSQTAIKITLKDLLTEQRLRFGPMMDTPRGSQPYANTVRLIKDLKAAGIKIGVGTSGGDAEKSLSSFGLPKFDAVVDADVAFKEGIPNKSTPGFYLTVARKLGVNPERCVLVEDDPFNIKVARDAGFGFIIGLARMGHEEAFRDAGARLVLSDIGDLSVDDIRAQLPGIQGAVFDMLGVINNNLPAHFYSFKETIERYLKLRADQIGETFKEFTWDDFQTFMLGPSGRGRENFGGLKPFFLSRNIDVPVDAAMQGSVEANAQLSEILDNDHKVQNQIFPNIKLVVTGFAGTVIDRDPQTTLAAQNAIAALLNVGVPVKVVLTGRFMAEYYKDIMGRVSSKEGRQNLEVYWAGGLLLKKFDEQGRAYDANALLEKRHPGYREKNFLSPVDCRRLIEKISELSNIYGGAVVSSVTWNGEAKGELDPEAYAAKFVVANFRGADQMTEFKKRLNEAFSGLLNIQGAGQGLFITKMVGDGFVKRRVFDDVILKEFKPGEVIDFGDTFAGGVDQELSELGIWAVSVDRNQSFAHPSVVKFDGYAGVGATVIWMRALEKYVRNRNESADLIQKESAANVFDLTDPSVQKAFQVDLSGLRSPYGAHHEEAEQIVRQRYSNREILPFHFTKFPDGKEKQYYLLARQLLLKKDKEGFNYPDLPHLHILAAIFYDLAHNYQGDLSGDAEELFVRLLRENNIHNMLEIGTGGFNSFAIMLNNILKSVGGSITIVDDKNVVDSDKEAEKAGVEVVKGFVGTVGFNGKKFDLIISSGVLSVGGQSGEDTISKYRHAMDLLYDSLPLLSDNLKARILANGLRSHLMLIKDVVKLVADIDVWDNSFGRDPYYGDNLDHRYDKNIGFNGFGFNILREVGASLMILKKNPAVIEILNKNNGGRIYPFVFTRSVDHNGELIWFEKEHLPANAEVLSTTNYHSYLYSGDKEKELHLNQYLNLYSVSKEGAEVAREIMSTKHDSDTAMASDVGGIDIQNIDVVHKNGSARIQFNEQAVRDVLKNGFAGFTPVIINITPIQSPLPLLGINPAKQPEEPLAKV